MTLTASVHRPEADDATAAGAGAGPGAEPVAAGARPDDRRDRPGTPMDWPSPPSCSGSSACW